MWLLVCSGFYVIDGFWQKDGFIMAMGNMCRIATCDLVRLTYIFIMQYHTRKASTWRIRFASDLGC